MQDPNRIPPTLDPTGPASIPILRGHNSRQIASFFIMVGIVSLATFLLARNPRTENLSLYVLGIGIPLGLLAIGLQRPRCGECRGDLVDVEEAEIEGGQWRILRCTGCGCRFRLKKDAPSPP